MAGKRIGLRDIAALEPGETRWDETLPGFGAHRQKSSAVSYVLFYLTMEARHFTKRQANRGRPHIPHGRLNPQ
jgi:hypothetical protein